MRLTRRAALAGALGVVGAGLAGAFALPATDPYRPRPGLPDGRLDVAAAARGVTAFGSHRLVLERSRLEVRDAAGRPLWWRDGAPLAAVHHTVTWREHLGHLTFTEDRLVEPHVRVAAVDAVDGSAVRVRGTVGPHPFTLTLTSRADRLRVAVAILGVDAAVLRFDLAPDEGLHGLGGQSAPDLRGHEVPIISREQGVGRGRQPLTVLAERTNGAGGAVTSTYTAIARATTGRRAFDLLGHQVSVWDARRGLDITHWRPGVTLDLVAGSGAAPHPEPGDTAWNLPGAIISAQGGGPEVDRKLGRLLDAGAAVSAVWCQDWPGRRTTSFGDRVWWLWQTDEERYPDPAAWAAGWRRRGVELFLYANPFVVDAADRPGWTGRNLFAEAVDRGFVVRRGDGSPYLLDQNGFDAALVDLSDPAAGRWFQRQLQDEYARVGATGGMADFAEGPPFDALLAGGAAADLHNAWPVLWTRYQPGGWSFQRAAGSAGAVGDERPTMMWAGDQLTTWDRYDGMASALGIILNAGVSGQPLMHADVGGYTGLSQPVVGTRRDAELLRRWAEWSVFSPVFRTHEGNQPARFAQVWDDALVAEMALVTRRFAALHGYRDAVFDAALGSGVPAMRPLWWDHPGTRAAATAGHSGAYRFGGFVVAPVLRPGASRVRVVLPPGRWRHVWSDRAFAGDRLVEVAAPHGRVPAFHRAEDSAAAEAAELIRDVR